MLIEYDEVEEQFAFHVFGAGREFCNTALGELLGDVLIEKALGVLSRAILAVIVD